MIAKNENINFLEHGRTISIKDLPDCRHKARLMNIVSNQDAKIIAVAMLQPNNREWTAYVGYPDVSDLNKEYLEDSTPYWHNDWPWLCENVRDIEQVKIMGEVLPKYVAEILFPDWKEKTYREGV